MIVWVGLIVSLVGGGCVIFPKAKQLWFEWIWIPNCLVKCCERQGISAVSHHQIGQVVHLNNMDAGHSWDVWKSLGNHNNLFYIRLGKFVRLFILDPVLVRQVLTSNADCYEKPSFIRSLSILGDGIFSSSGKDWFHQRKIFEPHFFSKKIKMKLELLKEVTVEAMHGWEQNLLLHDQEIDIYQRFLELTLRIFGKFAFGSDLRSSMDDIFLSFGRYLYNRRHGIFGLASPLPAFRLAQSAGCACNVVSGYWVKNPSIKLFQHHYQPVTSFNQVGFKPLSCNLPVTGLTNAPAYVSEY